MQFLLVADVKENTGQVATQVPLYANSPFRQVYGSPYMSVLAGKAKLLSAKAL